MVGVLDLVIPRDWLAFSLLVTFLFYVLKRFNAASYLKREKDSMDPDPIRNFDLNTARTRNHLYVNKTVRFPYHQVCKCILIQDVTLTAPRKRRQTMAHQPMHINDWIEIDSDYTWYIHEKTRVINEQGKLLQSIVVTHSLTVTQVNMSLILYRRMTRHVMSCWSYSLIGFQNDTQRCLQELEKMGFGTKLSMRDSRARKRCMVLRH